MHQHSHSENSHKSLYESTNFTFGFDPNVFGFPFNSTTRRVETIAGKARTTLICFLRRKSCLLCGCQPESTGRYKIQASENYILGANMDLNLPLSDSDRGKLQVHIHFEHLDTDRSVQKSSQQELHPRSKCEVELTPV